MTSFVPTEISAGGTFTVSLLAWPAWAQAMLAQTRVTAPIVDIAFNLRASVLIRLSFEMAA